jgi:ribosomal protein L23
MSLINLETEKSYNLQTGGFFSVVFTDQTTKTNKIELAKLLKQAGVEVVKINSIQPFFKKKRRQTKNGKPSTVLVKRPRKFLIKVKLGQLITKEQLNVVNEKLGLKVVE